MKAHQLLADCSKWTRGTYARNSNGMPCPSNSPNANQWCAIGAIAKCYHANTLACNDAVVLAQAASQRLHGEDLVRINDRWESGAYDAVIAVLREANV